jgi:hypothetical protein
MNMATGSAAGLAAAQLVEEGTAAPAAVTAMTAGEGDRAMVGIISVWKVQSLFSDEFLYFL